MSSKVHKNGAAPLAQPPVRKLRRDAKPDVIERVYDDSVQEPLTASEQGRD